MVHNVDKYTGTETLEETGKELQEKGEGLLNKAIDFAK